MKAPPRLIEEFQVFGHGHDILVALPLGTHLEVTEDLARDVGFERSLYQGAKTLLGLLKIGVLRGDIEKPETLELPKEPLRKAKKETGETCRRNSGGSACYLGRPRKPWPAESPLGPPVLYKRNGPCLAPFRSSSNPGWPE